MRDDFSTGAATAPELAAAVHTAMRAATAVRATDLVASAGRPFATPVTVSAASCDCR